MAKKDVKQPAFEQSLNRLEEIVGSLERGDVPLEQSIKMYEEGITLAKQCMDVLSQAEVKIKKLTKDMNGKLDLTEFE